jgi:ABC-type amino acid transport substrate-binding protein
MLPVPIQRENTVNRRYLLPALLVALVPALAFAQGLEGRLKRIKDTKTIAIAHRTDALPFAFVDESKQPTGYSVELCKRVVNMMDQHLGTGGLKIKWVPVTAQNRFDVVAKGEADMECGSSSVTLSRLKQVDFSSYIFVDGTAILARNELGAKSISDLSGKKIGVPMGSSNEKALRDALKDRAVSASVVAVSSREDGLAKVESGELDALASDQVLLLGLAAKAKNPKGLGFVDDSLSFEPYAIVLPRGDSALRIEVNTALARIYRSPAIADVYGQWFGAFGKPGPALRAVFAMGAIPD